MPKLNHDIIRFHVGEALEELQRIERELNERDGHNISEDALQVWFDHAFHHLNCAWNGRRATDKQFTNLTDQNFNRWSKFPRDINITKLRVPRSPSRKRMAAGKTR